MLIIFINGIFVYNLLEKLFVYMCILCIDWGSDDEKNVLDFVIWIF